MICWHTVYVESCAYLIPNNIKRYLLTLVKYFGIWINKDWPNNASIYRYELGRVCCDVSVIALAKCHTNLFQEMRDWYNVTDPALTSHDIRHCMVISYSFCVSFSKVHSDENTLFLCKYKRNSSYQIYRCQRGQCIRLLHITTHYDRLWNLFLSASLRCMSPHIDKIIKPCDMIWFSVRYYFVFIYLIFMSRIMLYFSHSISYSPFT